MTTKRNFILRGSYFCEKYYSTRWYCNTCKRAVSELQLGHISYCLCAVYLQFSSIIDSIILLCNTRTMINATQYGTIPMLYPDSCEREDFTVSKSWTIPDLVNFILSWSSALKYCQREGISYQVSVKSRD